MHEGNKHRLRAKHVARRARSSAVAGQARVLFRTWLLVFCQAFIGSSAYAQTAARIELLKHPYPYRAALTIVSDLHRTTIEEFEAVHRLVNTEELITVDRPEWRLLGLNNWATAEGRTSIRGFGFPFADAFLFYDQQFGWFSDYDEVRRTLLPVRPGVLDEKFREWYAKGFIGPIHTFGTGAITRRKATAAVDFLLESVPADRPIRIWVNHSKTVTPSGVANVCCTLLNQTLVDLRYRLLRPIGLGETLGEPDDLPGRQKSYGYILLLAVIALVGLSIIAILRWTRRSRRAGAACLMGASLLITSLHLTKVDFYGGDNPDSPYYNLDEIRRLGVRYFWTVNTDYWQATVRTIDLPERMAQTGRPSIFRVHEFNDGSSGLMFLRNTVDSSAQTLSLLSKENLERLVTREGRAILYLHWLTNPKSYFGTAAGAHALERLADNRTLIWITSAEKLLDHAYAYSYVEYVTFETADRGVVNITGFRDPIQGRVDAPLDRLGNVSFRCYSCVDLDVLLKGAPIPVDRVSTTRVGEDVIVTVKASEARSGESRTSSGLLE